MQCHRCGKQLSFGQRFHIGEEQLRNVCDECQREDKEAEHDPQSGHLRKNEKAEQEAMQRLQEAAERVILTTTNTGDGYYVKKYIVSIEYVMGTGLFSEVVTDLQDICRFRLSMFQTKLQKAKQESFEVLKMFAAQKNANSVVGIDFDYTEFSGIESL